MVRDGDVGQLSDEVIGAVVAAVRPVRPEGHGSAWQLLQSQREQIDEWVGQGLTVVKIGDLLARQGVVVPYRTLHRFCVECCGFGRGSDDGAGRRRRAGGGVSDRLRPDGPGPRPGTGRRRVVHALIFTAVYSRHTFVWLTFSQTLKAVIAGCEAAWVFFGGVFKVLVPDNMSAIVADADAVNPRFTPAGWTTPSTAGSPPTRPGSEARRTSPGWSGPSNMYGRTSSPGRSSWTWPTRRPGRCAGARDMAGQRIHGTTQARPAQVFAEQEAAALLAGRRPMTCRSFEQLQGAPRLPHRDRQGAVLDPEGLHRTVRGRAGRLGAGEGVLARPAGQGPSAAAARWAVDRPGRPARAQRRLRDARPGPARRRRPPPR